jgi:hypothetical protein
MTKLIAHRANLEGPSEKENELNSIMNCLLNYNYDIEIDVYFIEGLLHIGHDLPAKFLINTGEFISKFYSYKDRLWIHCKNIEAMSLFSKWDTHLDVKFNFFGHSNDEFVLTSFGYIFTRPDVLHKNAIVVMPELISDTINVDYFKTQGILTDYPVKYETYYNTIRS